LILKVSQEIKSLWDFQQKAVENAVKVLWKYYEDFLDFEKPENSGVLLIHS